VSSLPPRTEISHLFCSLVQPWSNCFHCAFSLLFLMIWIVCNCFLRIFSTIFAVARLRQHLNQLVGVARQYCDAGSKFGEIGRILAGIFALILHSLIRFFLLNCYASKFLG
jgi:hypothetical protein